MDINLILKNRNMTKYRLAKTSGVPHSTVQDICNGKTELHKCTAETVYKLAKALDISVESMIAGSVDYRPSFEHFKSTICHMVKDMGDLDFIIHILETDKIRSLYNKEWHAECLYLLAMLDYLSKENDLPICNEYNDLRRARLSKILYPLGVRTLSFFTRSDEPLQESLKQAIPEFLQYNIVESEIRNVV